MPADQTSDEKLQPQPSRGSTQLELSGLPGQQQHLTVVPVFPEGDPRNTEHPDGSPGQYKVTFILNRPGFSLLPEYQISFQAAVEGDSHIALTKPVATRRPEDVATIKIDANTEEGQHLAFVGRPNSQGFLARLETHVEASNFVEAEKAAHRALAPLLSNFSAQLDVPMRVFQMETVQLATGSTRIATNRPFPPTPLLVVKQGQATQDFRACVALYREALNSDSPIYQFLCFYKIIEALLALRRRIAVVMKAAGETPLRYNEIVPARPSEIRVWLDSLYLAPPKWDSLDLESMIPVEAQGKRASRVIDEYLRPLRVDVAHALFSEQGEITLSADELLHFWRVTKWLPVTRCLARLMLKNEFPQEFLRR